MDLCGIGCNHGSRDAARPRPSRRQVEKVSVDRARDRKSESRRGQPQNAKSGLVRAELGAVSTHCEVPSAGPGQVRPTLVKLRPNAAGFERIWEGPDQSSPVFDQMLRRGRDVSTTVGPLRPKSRRLRPHVRRVPPNSARFEQIWFGIVQMWGDFDHTARPVSMYSPNANHAVHLRGGTTDTPMRRFNCTGSETILTNPPCPNLVGHKYANFGHECGAEHALPASIPHEIQLQSRHHHLVDSRSKKASIPPRWPFYPTIADFVRCLRPAPPRVDRLWAQIGEFPPRANSLEFGQRRSTPSSTSVRELPQQTPKHTQPKSKLCASTFGFIIARLRLRTTGRDPMFMGDRCSIKVGSVPKCRPRPNSAGTVEATKVEGRPPDLHNHAARAWTCASGTAALHDGRRHMSMRPWHHRHNHSMDHTCPTC